MRYYKLQALFFLVCLTLYLFCCQIFYFQMDERSRKLELNRFQSILDQKRELHSKATQLQSHRFTNAQGKLEVLERCFQSYINRFQESFKHEDWKEHLRTLVKESPIPEAVGVFLGRRNKPYISGGGKDYQMELGEDWLKDVFLAMRYEGKPFRSRISSLYVLPIDREEFDNLIGQWQVIYHRNHRFLYRYHFRFPEPGSKKRKIDFLLLIDLDKTTQEKLQELVQNHLLEMSRKLLPSKGSQFVWGDNIESIDSDNYGLKYIGGKEGLRDFYLRIWPGHLLFLIVLFSLYSMGGYRMVFLRFEFKIFSSYAITMYVFTLLLLFLGEQAYFHRKEVLEYAVKIQMEQDLVELEQNYDSYLEKVELELARRIDSGKVFDGLFWRKGFNGIYLEGKDKIEFSRKDLDPHSMNSLVRITGRVLGVLKGAKTIEEVVQIREEYGLENHMQQTMLSQVAAASEKLRDQRLTESLDLNSRRRLKLLKVLGSTQYCFWDRVYKDKEIHLLLANFSNQALVKAYLDSVMPQRKSPFKVLSQSTIHSDQRVAQGEPDEDYFFTRVQPYRSYREKILSIKYQGEDHYLVVLRGSRFQKNLFFYIVPKQLVLSQLSDLERSMAQLPWVMALLSLLLITALLFKLMSAVQILFHGLRRIRDGNLGEISKVRGRDEAASLLKSLNSMCQELQTKESMLPFLSGNLLKLLQNYQEVEERGYQSRAVTLFSDIRSFTTISETNDPAEIVAMLNRYFTLWQEKAERHGGVIDSFVGDAIRIVFFEEENANFYQSSIQCALEVAEDLEKWNHERAKSGEFLISNGVGLAAGETSFHVVGNEHKLEFMLLGEGIRVAEILETESIRGQSSKIILDEEVHKATEHFYDFLGFDSLQFPDRKYFEVKL